MSLENGKLLCSATTGKLLCHPTTGKLLYGIDAKLVFDGDLVIVTSVLVTTAVLDTIVLRNPMTNPVDWELTITLDAALSGLVTFDPLSGTLIADEEKTITMTLSDPSALAVGAYAGTVVATDLAGVSTSEAVPVSITVQEPEPQWCGVLTSCDPDLLCEYNAYDVREAQTISCSWAGSQSIYSHTWKYGPGGAYEYVILRYNPFATIYRWSLTMRYNYMSSGASYPKVPYDLNLCNGPAGNYNFGAATRFVVTAP